jgi:hypothetical protein
MKKQSNGPVFDGAEIRTRPFTTDIITKMKKQQLMRVTLWQGN